MSRRNSAELDLFDTKIITLLQADGRRPNTEIARRLGVTEGAVRRRIDRLLRDKVIQVGAWADPLKLGYRVNALIEIQVNLPDLEKVAKRLAKLPEIFFLGICTGGYDIFAAAAFRSNEHMYEFMTKCLTRVSGITRTATSNVLRIVKREYTYLVPVGSRVVDRSGETDAIESSRAVPSR